MLGPQISPPNPEDPGIYLKTKKKRTTFHSRIVGPHSWRSHASSSPRVTPFSEGVIPYSMRFAADGASPTGDIGALVGDWDLQFEAGRVGRFFQVFVVQMEGLQVMDRSIY